MRVVFWIFRVVFAAFAGTILRLARRIAGKPPRIWHGPMPLHSIRYMVAADRAAGYPSRSVVLTEKQVKYDLVTRDDFDVVIRSDRISWYDLHWLALIDLLLHADIWSAHFDGLFFNAMDRRRNALAFRLIRACGIRIVVTAHGSDIVHLGRPPTRYAWIERMQRDYPKWDFAEQTPISLVRIELFCRYADLVFPGDSIMARLVPRNDLLFKVYPIDTNELRPAPAHAPARTVKIIHAPNHRLVKGTDFLLDAVERLRSRGFDCELALIEGVPRAKALQLYDAADVIADQFCMGGWAQFALEGMALGKPVLAYLDREHLGDPAFNLPVVNATPENLPEVLAAMIAVPELRTRIGVASRNAVERYQSISALAEVWDRIYSHVWHGLPLDLASTAHFSPERMARALTEDPLCAEFWPVAVDDLMPGIGEAVRRIRGT